MKTIVAAAQMTSTSDRAANLEQCEWIIERAHRLGVQFLSLPENFGNFLGDGESACNIAEPIDGPTIARLCNCAKKNGMWLSLGGFQERINGSKKIFNSHIVVDDRGEIVANYHKIHLFCAEVGDGNTYDENQTVESGDEVVVFSSPFFRCGLSICYDLRFPNLYSALRSKGAEVMLVPAAFTSVTGQAHWEILLRARAIETQSFIIAAAQSGRNNKNRTTYGHAMIIDPWGTPLAECGESDHLAVAKIDLEQVKDVRKKMPVWQHKKDFDRT